MTPDDVYVVRRDDRLRIERIPMQRLVLGFNRPLDPATVEVLRQAIAIAGHLDHMPVLVEPFGENFAIIDGHKRFASAVLEGRPDMLAIIKEPKL